MKPGCRSLLTLPGLFYVTSLTVLKAQQISVSPEVTGYIGHDVTLPCRLIPGPTKDTINQAQWVFLQPEGKEQTIIVSNDIFGINIPPDSPLKDRVEISGQSLIIKDVEMQNAGLYRCTLATFPSGTFVGETKLLVQEQLVLSTGVVSGIAIGVILLVGVMAAIAYFIFLRRHNSSIQHRVFIDTDGRVADVAYPSVPGKDEDVVYSDVKFTPSTDQIPSNNEKHTPTMDADVTYADVIIGGLCLDEGDKEDHIALTELS